MIVKSMFIQKSIQATIEMFLKQELMNYLK